MFRRSGYWSKWFQITKNTGIGMAIQPINVNPKKKSVELLPRLRVERLLIVDPIQDEPELEFTTAIYSVDFCFLLWCIGIDVEKF